MEKLFREDPLPYLVVTSINSPNRILGDLADGAKRAGWSFVIIGDVKSPRQFMLDDAQFFSISDQVASDLRVAQRCPTGHYARKNIGYLLAIRDNSPLIVETDDDNRPTPKFFARRDRKRTAPALNDSGWVNVYRYFFEGTIWPRGFPLDEIHSELPELQRQPVSEVDCPIQQGLADLNPDVDAIYRLTMPLPIRFRKDRRVAVGPNTFTPFNSQNTAWWPDAYPLLYLPAYCSFRMTDIWRSFVAQRIAHENDWFVLFHEPTVEQSRNEHSLMSDFRDEIPGYLHNRTICEKLSALSIKPGVDNIPDNLRVCYEELVRMEIVAADELSLLDCWLEDIRTLRR